MTIETDRNGKVVVMSLVGRLDTASAPQLERKIKQFGNDVDQIILDFAALSYISSMGLRVLLQTQKAMKAEGRKLDIKNMGSAIREVFEMTGFINLMVEEEKFVVIRKDEPNQIILSLIGQMDTDNVSGLTSELFAIQAANQLDENGITVVLDTGKLAFASDGACKLLGQAIEESAWEKRKVRLSGFSKDIKQVFENAGLGKLTELNTP
jgi:anti-anti-sigma factor